MSGFCTCTKLEIVLFSFRCRVIEQQIILCSVGLVDYLFQLASIWLKELILNNIQQYFQLNQPKHGFAQLNKKKIQPTQPMEKGCS